MCGSVDPAEPPTLVEIAVAVERGLPCDAAVGLSQQVVGDSGIDVALGEGSCLRHDEGRCSSGSKCSFAFAAVFVPLSRPVSSSAGAALAESCASSVVKIVGESVAVEPVDEPMGSLEGHVCSGSTASYVVFSEVGSLLVSECIVVIRDCLDVAVQTDAWLLKS